MMIKKENNEISQKPLALYVHWPFCKAKCPYCDFNSHVREHVAYDAWQKAYMRELEYFAPWIKERVITSIFFGGGTPSLMPPSLVSAIIEKCADLCRLDDEVEITLEANPTSVEAEKFKGFRQAGVNRVSLGIQSLRAKDLQFLGREHSKEEALHALNLARDIFPRYSFDLIYARPGQTCAAWEEELREALTYAGSHLSLYQLTIEKGTRFYKAYLDHDFTLPEEDEAAELYALTQAIMEKEGLPAYEISNHARSGEECRHNLAYWRYDDYLGIGPGAHSRITMEGKHHALMMTHAPEQWLLRVEEQGHGLQQSLPLTLQEIQEELLMMGLRTKEGVSEARVMARCGKPLSAWLSGEACNTLEQEGMLIRDKEGIRLTDKGFPLTNMIVAKLLLA